ncbi:MAG: hypothetical protein J6L59_03485 [Clostridia bacterium]|nr:hypothetical protein [Clostridia bacterium]
MNKNFKYYLSVWAILLVLFNVIVFVAHSEIAGMNKFGGAFWTGYIFIALAFIGQLICGYIALKAENLKKLFYNVPLISVSWTGLVLTLIFGTLCMMIPNLPNWVGIILCILVLGFTAISVIKAKLAADLVESVDDKIKTQTLFIKSLAVDAESLIARAKSELAKEECKKVYEAVRYSDPMSNDALSSVESEITIKFAKFSDAVTDDNKENAREIANELVILLGDRNKKCGFLK